jgi:DNA-binding transcriptional LysR family regulator
MDIVDLRYLAAAANAGNFGRAAKSLGLDTSTISRRIGRLEDELGFSVSVVARPRARRRLRRRPMA